MTDDSRYHRGLSHPAGSLKDKGLEEGVLCKKRFSLLKIPVP